MHQPKYLFHYTNINTLALILKNKNIRFSRLDNVDDLTEGETSDIGQLGQFVFISCWTDLTEECIPFWNMYTKDMSGVRIKLPLPIFRKYKISKENISDRNLVIGGSNESLFPLEELSGKDFFILTYVDILHKISYTDNKDILYPKVLLKEDSSNYSISLGKIGVNKNTCWEFESEWRFKLIIIPYIEYIPEKHTKEEHVKLVEKLFAKTIANNDFAKESYYLEIREDSFTQMEILVGPKHTSGDLEIVHALTKAYNPEARINVSNLYGKLR